MRTDSGIEINKWSKGVIDAIILVPVTVLFFYLAWSEYSSYEFKNESLKGSTIILAIIFLGIALLLSRGLASNIIKVLVGKPMVSLDKKGIYIEAIFGEVAVKWTECEYFEIQKKLICEGGRALRYIHIELKDDEKFLNSLSVFKRKIYKFNYRCGYRGINIGFGTIGEDVSEVIEEMKKYVEYKEKQS